MDEFEISGSQKKCLKKFYRYLEFGEQDKKMKEEEKSEEESGKSKRPQVDQSRLQTLRLIAESLSSALPEGNGLLAHFFTEEDGLLKL